VEANLIVTPLPLRSVVAPAAFPLEVLPGGLQAFVRTQSAELDCPCDYVAVPLLVVAGAALGNAWLLRLRDQARTNASLFATLVGPAGAGKSAAQRVVVGRLLEEQRRAHQSHREQCEDFVYVSGAMPEPPHPGWFVTSSYVPALVKEHTRGLAIVVENAAELMRWARRERERNRFLEAWDAEMLLVEQPEEERPFVSVRCPVIGLLGQMRPEALRGLRGEMTALTERMLFAFPEGRPSGPAVEKGDESGQRMWKEAVGKLVKERLQNVTCDVRFEPRAEERWLTWERQDCEQSPETLAGMWVKHRVYVMRLALVVQALRWACGEAGHQDVEEESVEAALRLIGYFRVQAQRVFGLVQSDPRQETAERIIAWLAAHPDCTRFRRRDLYRDLRRTFPRPEDLDAPLSLLEELGYVQREKTTGKGRCAVDWVIDEGWHRGLN